MGPSWVPGLRLSLALSTVQRSLLRGILIRGRLPRKRTFCGPTRAWVEFRCGLFEAGRSRGIWVEFRYHKGDMVELRKQKSQTRHRRNFVKTDIWVSSVGLVLQTKSGIDWFPIPTKCRCCRRCCPERTDTKPAPLEATSLEATSLEAISRQTGASLKPSPRTQLRPQVCPTEVS